MNKENMVKAAKLYGTTVFGALLNALIYISFISLCGIFADKDGKTSAGVVNAANVVALLFQLVLYITLIYSALWKVGNQDLNAVKFKRKEEDKFRGLKIGLIAAIPSLLSYVLLLAEKLVGFWSGYTALYRLGHLALYPLVVWGFGSNVANTVAGVGWGGLLLAGVPVLVLPITAFISYRIGYADILLGEKLVYKKKK